MSRWRSAAAPSTAIITADGHARLKSELDELWRVRRPEVVRALADAAAEGDRSENAEYIYRKKQLGEIDRRVRYLTKRLQNLRVVDEPPTDPNAVYFGAWIRLESEDGAENEDDGSTGEAAETSTSRRPRKTARSTRSGR